ncbi:MAG TPA: cupin domain-containing protein [Candidatus Paceibacterota bacterium]
MKIIRKNEAGRFENAGTCTAFEYETGGSDINVARIEIRGRYPVEGNAINKAVRELVYVTEGSGVVSVNGIESKLSQGDVVTIEKGEAVFWEGELTLVIACTPAWTPEQYVIDASPI